MQFPQRTTSHILEQESEDFFRSRLPKGWVVRKVSHDYGQDLNIEICEDNQMTALEFIVQLKSTSHSNATDENERMSLNISTYNYLKKNLRVVLLVKYIENENEAYWCFLKDVHPPVNIEQNSFTVYCPRKNKLSDIDWNFIVEHVRSITDTKLSSIT